MDRLLVAPPPIAFLFSRVTRHKSDDRVDREQLCAPVKKKSNNLALVPRHKLEWLPLLLFPFALTVSTPCTHRDSGEWRDANAKGENIVQGGALLSGDWC